MGHSNGRAEVEETPSAKAPRARSTSWSGQEAHSYSVRAAVPPVLTLPPADICWCCAMWRNQHRLERDRGSGEQGRIVVGTGSPGGRTEQDGEGSTQMNLTFYVL